MVKVLIDRFEKEDDSNEEFGYTVRTDVHGYSNLFYQNRARLMDGKFLLDATRENSVNARYHQFNIVDNSRKANRILGIKAREKATEFVRELVPSIQDRTSQRISRTKPKKKSK
ncbi:MAG: hypothetical protein AABW51_02165 [Nanoarchaeota archaeon]